MVVSFTMLGVLCAIAAERAPQTGPALKARVGAPARTDASPSDREAKQENDTKDDADKEEKDDTSGSPAKPPKLVVVVSKKNPIGSLKIDELRRIFLRQKTRWNNGWSITVFERSVFNPIRHEFSQRVLKKKPSELKEYWMNLQLTRGLKPPKALRSARLVERYLQRVKGGIGYMYEHEVDDTVKVIEIKGLKRAEPQP